VRGTTNKCRCNAFVVRKGHGSPCKNPPIRAGRAREWRELGWISVAEHLLIIGDAVVRPLGKCREHVIEHLEALRPGAARRLRRDTLKGWERNVGPMRRVDDAMQRAGLKAGRLKYVAPHGPRRCRAKAKSTGKQCGRWAERNLVTCYLHGARGGQFGGMKRGDPRIAASKRRTALKEAAREARKLASQRRAEAGLYPTSVGFRQERPAPSNLESFFRSHHGRAGRKLGPLY
jgi:hypothetical protein